MFLPERNFRSFNRDFSKLKCNSWNVIYLQWVLPTPYVFHTKSYFHLNDFAVSNPKNWCVKVFKNVWFSHETCMLIFSFLFVFCFISYNSFQSSWIYYFAKKNPFVFFIVLLLFSFKQWNINDFVAKCNFSPFAFSMETNCSNGKIGHKTICKSVHRLAVLQSWIKEKQNDRNNKQKTNTKYTKVNEFRN